VGLSQAAFDVALAYARTRKQFGIPIVEQPLVRTLLAKMAVNIEASRALLYRTLTLTDWNLARHAALERGDGSPAERDAWSKALERDTQLVRLLTPLTKYFATEICDDLTRDAMQVLGGIGFTMEVDVAKLHADSLILTIYEGTSEIQASFALREMGKGALATLLGQVRDDLERAATDDALAPLAERVKQSCGMVDEAAKILFADLPYALLRAKLVAEMVINLVAASQLLRQAQVDPAWHDLAEAFVIRRMLENELGAKRIAQNHAGRLERDARILGRY
jgi:hypothetical protein